MIFNFSKPCYSKKKGPSVFVSRRYSPFESQGSGTKHPPHFENSSEAISDRAKIEDAPATTNSKFNYLDYTAWRNFWGGDWPGKQY